MSGKGQTILCIGSTGCVKQVVPVAQAGSQALREWVSLGREQGAIEGLESKGSRLGAHFSNTALDWRPGESETESYQKAPG